MRKLTLYCFIVFIACSNVLAQIPDKPMPPRLVNDLAGLFTPQQAAQLEQRLVAFNDSTSNQIVVLTVNELNGYEVSEFAYEVGAKWKVGQAKFDNGVVIVIKPKIGNSYGEAFIASGYGVEGVLPDATCAAVVNNEMIPHFRNNDYYDGVNAALDVVLPILTGEYSYKNYDDGEIPLSALIFFGLFFVGIIVLLVIVAKKGGKGGGTGRGFLGGFLLGNMTSGGGRSSWGGGSSGGFGGFGGGSFGGGGGGGRW